MVLGIRSTMASSYWYQLHAPHTVMIFLECTCACRDVYACRDSLPTPSIAECVWGVVCCCKTEFLITGSLFEEYCALAEYQADDESQVSFKSGQVVLVLDKDSSGKALYVHSSSLMCIIYIVCASWIRHVCTVYYPFTQDK